MDFEKKLFIVATLLAGVLYSIWVVAEIAEIHSVYEQTPKLDHYNIIYPDRAVNVRAEYLHQVDMNTFIAMESGNLYRPVYINNKVVERVPVYRTQTRIVTNTVTKEIPVEKIVYKDRTLKELEPWERQALMDRADLLRNDLDRLFE